MRRATLFLALGLFGCGSTAVPGDGGPRDAAPVDAPPAPRPEAMTEHGPVRGTREGGSLAFLGIPYAAPPVGELRWRSPEPPAPWTEPRASTRPPRCSQAGFGFGRSGQEDCLYLNVHTPDPRPNGAPVMVWIHGGGFTFGEGLQIDEGTAGDKLAAEHGVVVVSMNYRLGPFGFLAHPALGDEASGNFAIADQRAALEWVRDNIAAFGGDPENVTLFGESAGGVSVCAHLVSPASAGLFHRAITQSGLCDTAYRTREEAEASGIAFATSLGCASDDVAACLRAATAEAVQDQDPAEGADLGARIHWPTADGSVLPGDFRAQVEAGAFHRVPTVVGWNADEGTLFVMLAEQRGAVADAATYASSLVAISEQTGVPVEAIRAQYPLEAYPEPGAAIADALGHASLACPSRRAARLLADAGVDVRVYRFDYTEAGFQLVPTRELGAFHSAEIQYVFGHPATLGQARFRGADLALHQAMAGYWTRFAATGDPNGEGAVSWPAYDSSADAHLVLDTVIATGTAADAEACLLWDSAAR